MPQEYEALANALKESGIPFAEYGWKTAPTGDYGVISLEFETDHLDGNDGKQIRAFEGSIDLFFRNISERDGLISTIENVLNDVCGASWTMNSFQHENNTGYFHVEWVFQVEE